MIASLAIGADEAELKRHQHAQTLCDAGFFHEVTDGGVYWMTNQGYDYLECIRNDQIWEKTKGAAAQMGGATLGILREIAAAYLKQEARSKLGIEL